MVKVAIVGATGYTALELIELLLNHPQAEIAALVTRQEGSPAIDTVHASLSGRLDLACENLSPAEIAKRARFVFTALPHVASMAIVPDLLKAGCRVVDLIADYRFNDPAVYGKMVRHPHTDRGRLGKAVYGLPELFGDRIPRADLVANPGCYTSTAILGLAPFLCGGLIEPKDIIVDGKSGVSVPAAPQNRTCTMPSATRASRPIPSAVIATSRRSIRSSPRPAASRRSDFTPHLVPMDRGILCTIYARPKRPLSEADALQTMRKLLRRKALCAGGEPAPQHQGRRPHELLPDDGPHRTRPPGDPLGDRQPDQGGRRRGGSKFQLDERIPETTGLPR